MIKNASQEMLLLNHKEHTVEARFSHLTGFCTALARWEREPEILACRGSAPPSNSLLLLLAVPLKGTCTILTQPQFHQQVYLSSTKNRRHRNRERSIKREYLDFYTYHFKKSAWEGSPSVSLNVKYLKPYWNEPQTLRKETSPRHSHAFQCTSAPFLGRNYKSV